MIRSVTKVSVEIYEKDLLPMFSDSSTRREIAAVGSEILALWLMVAFAYFVDTQVSILDLIAFFLNPRTQGLVHDLGQHHFLLCGYHKGCWCDNVTQGHLEGFYRYSSKLF